MREKACVVDIKGDKIKVVITRHSACSKCNKDCILGMEGSDEKHEKEEMYILVNNSINAKKGDTVNIELKDSSLVMGSLIIYLLPLIFFVFGYFVGTKLYNIVNIFSAEIVGIITSFVFLYLSYLVTKRIDKSISNSNRFRAEIVNIVNEN